jgi:hypothetical protein
MPDLDSAHLVVSALDPLTLSRCWDDARGGGRGGEFPASRRQIGEKTRNGLLCTLGRYGLNRIIRLRRISSAHIRRHAESISNRRQSSSL